MPFLSQRAAEGFTGLVRGVLSILAIPIREAHQVIGHSTVTAALLLSVTLFGSVWLWSSATADLQGPAFEALQREREARAVVYEQQAAEAGFQAPSRTWGLGNLQVTEEGITFRYTPLKGAKWLILSWTVRNKGALAASGMDRYEIPDPVDETPVIQDVTIPKATVGAAWVTGNTVWIEAEQFFADRAKSRYIGQAKSGTLP